MILLVILDLSAAFDTIDHSQLLNRLQTQCGIIGNALAWFHSHLKDRKQSVKINNTQSKPTILKYGVPQGSVLGPILFTLYTTPISYIVSKYKTLNHHLYADDTQLYLTLTPETANCAIPELQSCLDDIQAWMSDSKLKLNPDKTESIVLGSKYKLKTIKNLFPISILGNKLYPSSGIWVLYLTQRSSLIWPSQ